MLDLDLVPALTRALDDGSLLLHYQPEVDLRTRRVFAMEAVLRWQHPERGLLRPRQFFAVAEAAGLVKKLGAWAFRTGIAQARTWPELTTPDDPPRLWLNAAAAQLTAPGFAVAMERLVVGRAMPPGSVGLDVTEETLAAVHHGAPRLLDRLHDLGLALAVDGFGAWHASLATFDALPLDVVKLDRRFVRVMLDDVEGEAVLASLVSLAHRRDLAVVAEGVERPADLRRLALLGCDRAAGRALCPPVPLERAREIVAAGRVATRVDVEEPADAYDDGPTVTWGERLSDVAS